MAKNKVTVRFERKITYQADIEVSDKELEILKEYDGEDITQYIPRSNFSEHPAYDILNDYALEGNEIDWDDLENFEIVEE